MVRCPVFLAIFALALPACRNGGGGGGGSASPTPSPAATSAVPEGYRGLAWGTPREEIAKKHPDAQPGKRNPGVLVRDAKLGGRAATEAFFFDDAGGLTEVEIVYTPKLTPQESAGLGILMDGMFGPHDITAAEDEKYQYAWIGNETEVRLTYDLRESVTFGPVVSYTRREAPPEPATSGVAATSPTPALPVPTEPGARFAMEVRAARAEGKRLLAIESAAGKLTLVLGGAAGTTEISLTADPKTGALLGSASLPRAGIEGAPKERAEKAIDAELAKGDPIRLTFGSPGNKDAVTLVWEDDRFVTLDPRAPDPLLTTGKP